MKEDAEIILCSMGYVVNQDEFVLHHINDHIEELAYQLYLSQLYCRKVKLFFQSILDNGYGENTAVKLFEHFGKPDFIDGHTLDYCQIIQKSPNVHSVNDFQETPVMQQRRYQDEQSDYNRLQSTQQRTAPVTSMSAFDIDDRELYEAGDSKNVEQLNYTHMNEFHKEYLNGSPVTRNALTGEELRGFPSAGSETRCPPDYYAAIRHNETSGNHHTEPLAHNIHTAGMRHNEAGGQQTEPVTHIMHTGIRRNETDGNQQTESVNNVTGTGLSIPEIYKQSMSNQSKNA